MFVVSALHLLSFLEHSRCYLVEHNVIDFNVVMYEDFASHEVLDIKEKDGCYYIIETSYNTNYNNC